MTYLPTYKSLSVLCCAFAISACQSTGMDANPQTAHYFDGKNMTGTIRPSGCRSTYASPWVAKLIDGKVVGHMMSAASDNEPEMRSRPQKFSLPIRDDGTFGSLSGDGPHRLWLRWWASTKSGYGSNSPGSNKRNAHKSPIKEAKYSWVSGQVLKNGDINLKVRWGTSLGHGSCSGNAYFINGTSDEDKIMTAVKNAPNICSGGKAALKDKSADLIKSLKAEGAIDKSKDFDALDFRIGRIYAHKCKT